MLMPSDLRSLARNVYRRKIDNYQRYRLLLLPLGQSNDLSEGYRSLVWLLREGYLTTVVTLNSDTFIEKMLYHAGIQATVLEIGKDANSQIAEALDDPPTGICIVKLHLYDTASAQPENILSSLPEEIFSGLKVYVQKAIVIVGSKQPDLSFIHMLKSVDVSSVYYILPYVPTVEDVIHTIEQNFFSVFGLCGEFTLFFATIVALIQNGVSAPLSYCQPDDTGQSYQHALLELDEFKSSPSYQEIILPELREVGLSPPLSIVPTFEEIEQITRPASAELQTDSTLTSNSKHPPRFAKKSITMKADVLLATATPLETQAVLSLFPHYQEITIRQRNYYNLGRLNDLKIMLVQQAYAGSYGTGGSHISTQEAIRALSPFSVIMVGIAFGIDATKQNIGDILISQQIQDWDPQRVSLGPDSKPVFESRGVRVTASTHLLDLFHSAHNVLPGIWTGKPPEVQFGLILSGSKLVDHLEYRDELRRTAPDAIGGEMEGIGLYYAASGFTRRVHWILVKAISDWADGNKNMEKNDRQLIAARNAAFFTHQVLQRGGFTRHRSQKKS